MTKKAAKITPIKGVVASDIKAFFKGISVSVTLVSRGIWSVRAFRGEGAYRAPTYASWAEKSYPGHRVIVEQATA